MSTLKPFYENMQAIYDEDRLTEFLGLFLDPTMLYSCAYFERDDMTLEEAQLAKLDLALGKCDLHPGQRLLEIGCGWGACARRAAEEYGVNVIGLTLSRNQRAHCLRIVEDLAPGSGQVEIRLRAWEEFDEPVDRIVSIAAFEHFRMERYADFFQRCRRILPDDGIMLLHTGAFAGPEVLKGITHEDLLFYKFMIREIFPGGQLSSRDLIATCAESAGFTVARVQSLGSHYARTLDVWAANLEAAREQAIELTSRTIYDRYMKYLTGCAKYYKSGVLNLVHFTLHAS